MTHCKSMGMRAWCVFSVERKLHLDCEVDVRFGGKDGGTSSGMDILQGRMSGVVVGKLVLLPLRDLNT